METGEEDFSAAADSWLPVLVDLWAPWCYNRRPAPFRWTYDHRPLMAA